MISFIVGDDMNLYGRFYRIWAYFSDLIILAVCWLMTSLLGFGLTIGASTTAVYQVLFKLIHPQKDYYVFKDYMKAFKDNFKTATSCWLVCIATGCLIYLGLQIAINSQQTVVYFLFLGLALIFGVSLLYLFPIIAKFETNLTGYFVSSLIMANRHLLTSLLLVGSIAFLVFLFFKTNGILILVLPGLYFLYSGYLFHRLFTRYASQI